MQAWRDDGRSNLPPEQIDTPFQLLAPVARTEADSFLRQCVIDHDVKAVDASGMLAAQCRAPQ